MHFLWYAASIDACKLRNHGTAAEIAPFSWRSALCTCTATNHRNNAHEMRAWVDVSGTPTNGVAQGREGTDLRPFVRVWTPCLLTAIVGLLRHGYRHRPALTIFNDTGRRQTPKLVKVSSGPMDRGSVP